MLAGIEKQSLFPAPVSIGPQVLVQNPTGMTVLPATIGAGLTYDSGVIICVGFKTIAAGTKLDQTGTITIQRYLDAAGAIPVGALISSALVANTANWVTSIDNTPFQSFRVVITNTSVSLGTLAANATMILLGSA